MKPTEPATRVGGIFEVVAHGLPRGLGSHITWDSRLDGKLAQAIVSMQAVKGVEVGGRRKARRVSDRKCRTPSTTIAKMRRFFRGDNRAGGLEGGMTNGEDLRVRGFLKPISTLRRPLESVDLETREPALAAYERSDICVVPAAGVIGEAMVAIVLAEAFLEKFGGDSLQETQPQLRGLSASGSGISEMVYKIVKYGNPVLEQAGGPDVTNFDTPELSN